MTTASKKSQHETYKESVRKLVEREQHLKDYEQQTKTVFEIIRQLMTQPEKPRKVHPACPVECEAYSTGVKFLPREMRSLFLWGVAHFSGGRPWQAGQEESEKLKL